MTDIAELIDDPDFCTSFTIMVSDSYRQDDGEWIEGFEPYKMTGVIQPASSRDTAHMIDGDEYRGAINVWARQMIATADNSERCAGLGDLIDWHCKRYRVVNSKDWSQYGYWQAMAVEVDGDG